MELTTSYCKQQKGNKQMVNINLGPKKCLEEKQDNVVDCKHVYMCVCMMH